MCMCMCVGVCSPAYARYIPIQASVSSSVKCKIFTNNVYVCMFAFICVGVLHVYVHVFVGVPLLMFPRYVALCPCACACVCVHMCAFEMRLFAFGCVWMVVCSPYIC